MAVWSQFKVRRRGLSLWPVGCTPTQLQYAACGAI